MENNQDHPPPPPGYPPPGYPPQPPGYPPPGYPPQPHDYPPPGYPSPSYPPPPGYPPPPPLPRSGADYPGKSQSMASLVLGIVSLIVPGFGLITSLIGLFLGISGRRQALEVGAPTELSTAGIVLSIIGLAGAALTALLCISCLTTGFAAMDPYGYGNAWDWY